MADGKNQKALNENELKSFLNTSLKFVETTLSSIVKASGKHEDVPLIESHGKGLTEQFKKVSNLLLKSYAEVNLEQQRSIDLYMKTQAVSEMADSARLTVEKTFAKGVFGDGIFSWLESNFEEIKKILIELIEIFFPLPPWVHKLFQVLNQIFKLILGLFGGVLGRNRSKVVAELSQMEIGFWNELASYRRYAIINPANNKDIEEQF